jgi:hypothetical protein
MRVDMLRLCPAHDRYVYILDGGNTDHQAGT